MPCEFEFNMEIIGILGVSAFGNPCGSIKTMDPRIREDDDSF